MLQGTRAYLVPQCSVYNSNDYNNFGNNAYFWSATQNNSNNAYNRNLNYNNADVNSNNNNKNNGFSVRCVRD